MAQSQKWGWAIFSEPAMHDITTITLESQRPRRTTARRASRDWRGKGWIIAAAFSIGFWAIFCHAISAMIWGR